jgi:FkbM family methyltransferase
MAAVSKVALSQSAKGILSRLGVSVRRYAGTLGGERRDLLAGGEVAVVIDVGAHMGEYGGAIRAAGYRGPIFSFEPVSAHFERLLSVASGDPAWSVRKAGVGAEAGTATINVSGNEGFSSSVLEMNEAHVRAVSDSRYERSEEIEVVSLDDELGADRRLQSGAYLKVDTQGYEQQVIAGAHAVLGHCVAVELELSLKTLYEGQLLIGEMIELMRERDFVPTNLEPEFVDPQSNELLQVNCLFRRA